ncbi:MAG: hydrogenase maturation nickel metallochaperone HypA [Candidatus Aminicenantes bacterium]|nr:MAG: hydrogenase maturation nickel metallochaperone HypA [Candidatus Aminicenantes bacterium]
MHEFALAQDIVETISRKVAEDLNKVTAIHIDVGEFSGVVADSLEFGLTVILADKNLPNVNVNITIVPVTAVCECSHEYQIKDILENCPRCHSFNRKITSGADVIIRSIELMG